MGKRYQLIFDKVIKKQLTSVDSLIKSLLTKLFDKMECLGPQAGNLIDSKLHLYEMKQKRPPIRLYFRYIFSTDELQVFEFEMKKRPIKQKKTISKLRKKLSES